jgi:hypothetical protein
MLLPYDVRLTAPFLEDCGKGAMWLLHGLIKRKHVGKKTREKKEERKERPKASVALIPAYPIGKFASSTGQHLCRLNEIKAS